MSMTTSRTKESSLHAHCRAATIMQLFNIYEDEQNRARRHHGTDTGRAAKAFAAAARRELIARKAWE